ncbi:energy-coupling factor transporter transmembrane component T [Clostridium sp.]|jgi:cobalt/nickel transport system permease protein|uniref:energy-coupling factor transporter transmembrane component T family protein n=1 Tax=Clostridium sp. TaxID=1506 RepID=UPI00258A2D06|nr:energy-coupling factor transporter transmembrane component T [Clostridium sp.]MDF2502828.1 cobalt transport protein [Clostridium sp.]
MPEWLLKKDSYTPEKDKNTFIHKSILSLLGVILKFRYNTKSIENRLRANALTKLISTLILIVFVSLSKSFTFVVIADVYLLVVINLLNIGQIRHVLRVSVGMGIFTFIILLPSIFGGYGNNSLMIALKVLFSVSFVNILACTTAWTEIIASLKAFRIPDMFIFILDITIKYIIVLGEFSLNMVYALKLRSIGRSKNKNLALSGIIGTMFIKSKDMSEEMYSAMECRGFTGEYKIYKKFKFKTADYICIILDIIFILAYFYFDRL